MELKKVLKSFTYAFNGFYLMLKERNFRVHIIFMIIALLLSILLRLSPLEFALIILAIVGVLAAESFNTSIENLANIVRDEFKLEYTHTKELRDISAFAVLVLSVGAFCLAFLVFLPKIIALFIK